MKYVNNIHKEIEKIASLIASSTTASRIILFGSSARGPIKEGSDIDLCVITDVPRRKIDILKELNRTVGYESRYPIDLLVYTSKEFAERADSSTSFEHRIQETGIDLL